MTVLLPRELIATELPDGVRYSLPRRRPGRFTGQAAVHLLGSVLLGIPFLSLWLWGVGYDIAWQDLWRAENGLLFLAFGLWMLLMAVRLGGVGCSGGLVTARSSCGAVSWWGSSAWAGCAGAGGAP
jgi:hypothetical protein